MSQVQPLAMSKAPDAFRTISEVAEELDIPQHVLRFWESRFTSIKPLKRGGGRRYYRPDDVELLRGIRQLLYGQGFTIKGVQRILKEEGAQAVQSVGRGGTLPLHRPEPPEPEQFAARSVSAPEAHDWSEPDVEPAGWRPSHGPPTAAPVAELPSQELDRLRGALAELHECQRVLEAMKRR